MQNYHCMLQDIFRTAACIGNVYYQADCLDKNILQPSFKSVSLIMIFLCPSPKRKPEGNSLEVQKYILEEITCLITKSHLRKAKAHLKQGTKTLTQRLRLLLPTLFTVNRSRIWLYYLLTSITNILSN